MKAVINGFVGLSGLIFSCGLFAASAYRVDFQGARYDVYSVNPSERKLRFVWKDTNGRNYSNFGNIKSYLAGKKNRLVFATNGGIFTSNHAPLGLYIENRIELQTLNIGNGRGNFYLKPNGIFYVTETKFGIVNTIQYNQVAAQTVLYATQSGPLLLINGRTNPNFKKYSRNFYIRSGVGIDQSGNAIFAISNTAINFYTFSLLFKEKLQCVNALYLDGAISKMYLPQIGRNELGGDFAVIIVGVED